MKKTIVILFFIFFSSISIAHMGHYNKYNKIEMEIFRNGKLIGYNYYFFTRKGNETIITNQIRFSVKILGTTIFQVEGHGEEKYFKDQLISYNSKGSSYSGEASIKNIVGNWWNHKILQTDSQISPISGSIKKQVVTFIAKEKIDQYGKIYEVDHFKLKSKDMSLPRDKRLDFDIWFDKKRSIILRVSYSRMGNWEYRLKSFE